MALPLLHFVSCSPPEICGDIVESYRLAAEQLGYPTSYAGHAIPGPINILFFVWGVAWSDLQALHPHCIVVNFEPLVPGTHAWLPRYLGALKQCYLWEYSESTFQRHVELGFRVADYVPLGYQPGAALEVAESEVLPDAEQDLDVVFFGTMTERRTTILNALLQRGLRLAVPTTAQGWPIEERDGYLRRAKLVLNFHNWDNSRVVEIARLATLFRQRKAVVCELYPDSELPPILRGAVVQATYESLIDTVLALLADAPRRAALENAGLPLLRQLRQIERVGPALERFLQWREQQGTAPSTTLRVAVCAHIPAWSQAWHLSLSSLAEGTLQPLWVITTPEDQATAVQAGLEAAGVRHTRLTALPSGIDAAAALNWAQQTTEADALLFCAPGEFSTPQRLAQLAAFLESQPTLDIVTHWLLSDDKQVETAPIRTPELDHEIKAELLGPRPLALSHALIRRRFVLEKGLRHDAEHLHPAGLHWLCKAAAAGARFGTLAQGLMQASTHTAQLPPEPLKGMPCAQRLWLQACFSHLSQEEIQLLESVYASFWAPDADFAERLLRTLAQACVHAPEHQGTVRATLARVFRAHAQRLLSVFAQAKLIDQDWIDARFAEPDIALFLTPISTQLPIRPRSQAAQQVPMSSCSSAV